MSPITVFSAFPRKWTYLPFDWHSYKSSPLASSFTNKLKPSYLLRNSASVWFCLTLPFEPESESSEHYPKSELERSTHGLGIIHLSKVKVVRLHFPPIEPVRLFLLLLRHRGLVLLQLILLGVEAIEVSLLQTVTASRPRLILTRESPAIDF